MTSKEALEKIYDRANHDEYLSRCNKVQALNFIEDNKKYRNIIEQYLERLEKLEKVIEILKGRMCVHNGYVCYDAYADIKLKDEEIDLLYEVLSYEEI